MLIFCNYSQQSRDSGHAFLESYDVYMGVKKKYIFLRVSILGTDTLQNLNTHCEVRKALQTNYVHALHTRTCYRYIQAWHLYYACTSQYGSLPIYCNSFFMKQFNFYHIKNDSKFLSHQCSYRYINKKYSKNKFI